MPTTRKSKSGTQLSGKPLRTLEGHTGTSTMWPLARTAASLVSASTDRHLQGLAPGRRPAHGHAAPAAQSRYPAIQSRRPIIVAAGADNNIRSGDSSCATSPNQPDADRPVRPRRGDHPAGVPPDGSKLLSLAEDLTIKVWRTSDYSELKLWENQPDVPTALALAPDGAVFRVGRMDGSLARIQFRPSSRSCRHGVFVGEVRPHAGSESRSMRRPSRAEQLSRPGQPADTPCPSHRRNRWRRGSVPTPTSSALRPRPAKSGCSRWTPPGPDRALDSFLEVLDGQGRRVPRVLLQAVRDSYFTFRGKNDSEFGDFRVFNWDETHIKITCIRSAKS